MKTMSPPKNLHVYFIKRYDCTSPATFKEGISEKDFGMGRHLLLCQKQSFIL
jgi:hypothetical protein